ncbi:MAG: hypothetical protein JWP97_5935 [Labilithrix sp.]|nr:hypothetical protein [Labilithrix sp.]
MPSRLLLVVLAACSGSGTHEEPATPLDSGAPPPSADADADAGSGDGWARYVIETGAHAATLTTGASGNPRDGLASGVAARDYELALDASAAYVLTAPTQPDDQLDWNKLPGLSDCGSFDLAADGLMFGWRYRPDTAPARLEITAYANNAGAHLTADEPLVSLDADDLTSATPLRYRLRMDAAVYSFRISGVVRGRVIEVEAALPRRCAETAPESLVTQWAGGFYFGGTSTAPSRITAGIFEHR